MNVTPLPSPPLVEQILFESPLLPAIALAVGAVVAIVVLNARSELRKGLLVGGILLALAATNLVVASLVTTERERLRTESRSLVEAVKSGNRTAIERHLAPGAIIRSRMHDHVEVRDVLGQVDRHPVRSTSIREIQATLDGVNVARTLVDVTVTPETTAFPTRTVWLLHWQLDEDWKIILIEPQYIAGIGDMKG